MDEGDADLAEGTLKLLHNISDEAECLPSSYLLHEGSRLRPLNRSGGEAEIFLYTFNTTEKGRAIMNGRAAVVGRLIRIFQEDDYGEDELDGAWKTWKKVSFLYLLVHLTEALNIRMTPAHST